MVKHAKPAEGIGKVKIRFIEIDVEGSDASIQDSLRSLTAALNRSNAVPSARQLRGNGVKAVETEPEVEPADETEDSEVAEVEEVERPAKRTKPAGPTKVAVYSVLTDIKFDDVEPTLVEFAATKAPPSELAKYLVIAYWFKNIKGIANLKVEHFFTAYKVIGWKVPRNPALNMRELRAKRDQRLSAGSEDGTSVINHLGEGFVEKLPKG